MVLLMRFEEGKRWLVLGRDLKVLPCPVEYLTGTVEGTLICSSCNISIGALRWVPPSIIGICLLLLGKLCS